jgi:hypothetical protein
LAWVAASVTEMKPKRKLKQPPGIPVMSIQEKKQNNYKFIRRINMLSEQKELEFEILEICKNSGDVNVGDRFDGVMYNSEFGDRPCVCIGKTNNTRLFVTEDKRCYFTVSGGWA